MKTSVSVSNKAKKKKDNYKMEKIIKVSVVLTESFNCYIKCSTCVKIFLFVKRAVTSPLSDLISFFLTEHKNYILLQLSPFRLFLYVFLQIYV